MYGVRIKRDVLKILYYGMSYRISNIWSSTITWVMDYHVKRIYWWVFISMNTLCWHQNFYDFSSLCKLKSRRRYVGCRPQRHRRSPSPCNQILFTMYKTTAPFQLTYHANTTIACICQMGTSVTQLNLLQADKEAYIISSANTSEITYTNIKTSYWYRLYIGPTLSYLNHWDESPICIWNLQVYT